MFVILNGKFINEEKAAISINNRSFRYGDGCFETMRLFNDRLPLAGFHFERLFQTLGELQFEFPAFFTASYLEKEILQLAEKNQQLQNARIRLTIFRGNGGLYDPENMQANWLIQSWPLEPVASVINSNGLTVGVYEKGFKAADGFANLKTNNFLLYSQAAIYAKQQHWNDAVVLNHRNTVADATIANLFLVKENSIIAPPLSDGPVAGVMRRHLLTQLPLLGFDISEKSISIQGIEQAEEAFLSNAIYGIKWIQAIGEKQFALTKSPKIYQQIVLPLFS